MLRLYGQDGETPPICPGEANCDRFQSTAGRGHKEKVRKACFTKGNPCPMVGTKTDAGKKSHGSLMKLTERALKIRREKVAGYPRDKTMMANVEYETYLLIDDMCDEMRIGRENKLLAYLKAGFQLEER